MNEAKLLQNESQLELQLSFWKRCLKLQRSSRSSRSLNGLMMRSGNYETDCFWA